MYGKVYGEDRVSKKFLPKATFFPLVGMQTHAATLENRRVFVKLSIYLPEDPAIPCLGMYPREMKTYVYTKTCI